MTDIKKIIAETREKEKAASPGPWEFGEETVESYGSYNVRHFLVSKDYCGPPSFDDCALIECVRNNITAILDYVENLEKENKSLNLLFEEETIKQRSRMGWP